MLDKTTKQSIGISYILDNLNILSDYGKMYLYESTPFYNLDKVYKSVIEIEEEFRNIEYFLNIYNIKDLNYTHQNIAHLKNIKPLVKKTVDNYLLDTVDLYEIKIQSIVLEKIRMDLNTFLPETFKLHELGDIITLLNPSNKVTEDFYIYNEYSEKLRDIRNRKREIEQKYFIESDDNERKILHQLRSELVIEEQNEEHKVRSSLSKTLKHLCTNLLKNIELISHIDYLFSKCDLVRKYNGIRPSFNDNSVEFVNVSNPYFNSILKANNELYKPISIEMGKGSTIITGANMGGKSSSVRTVLLNMYLAHCGFYCFAEYANIPFVNNFYYVCSESDNALHGLSTFGVEVIKLNEIISSLKEDNSSFIVVDEFARSTNPNEGMKFVKALANYAHTKQSYTLLTTHFDKIPSKDMKHYQVKGFNSNLTNLTKDSFKKQINEYMDYSLIEVSFNKNVPKEALTIAKLLGLDSDFEKEIGSLYKEDMNE